MATLLLCRKIGAARLTSKLWLSNSSKRK